MVAGVVGHQAGGVHLVAHVIVVFSRLGVVLGQESVAEVDVVLEAGTGLVILGQKFAVKRPDIVGVYHCC